MRMQMLELNFFTFVSFKVRTLVNGERAFKALSVSAVDA